MTIEKYTFPLSKQERPGVIKILIFSIAALLLNVVFAYASAKLHLIVFMDTIFTVALTFYAGLIPGILVAMIYNPLITLLFCLENGTKFFFYDSLYGICGILIVVITWFISRNKKIFSHNKSTTVLYLVIISFASAIASCLCASLLDTFVRPLFGQVSGFGITDDFSYSFRNLKLGDFLSYLLPRIPITVLDRLICTFAGFTVYKIILP